MTTTTANYGWQMPDPGGSANTWGNTLNATTQAIDAQVFANAKAGVPIGSISMFGGATPPANWLLCNGASLATVGTYAALFAVLQYAFGGSGANFNLPNLQGVFPRGAGPSNALGSAAGSYSYTIALANLPSHAHPIEQTPHSHGASQPAHNHADQGHPHGASQDAHNHTVANAALGSGVNIQPGSGFNMVNTATTSTAQPNVYVATGYANLAAAQPAITVNAGYANINNNTTDSVGSGTAMSIVPSYVAINFIIKYQ